MATQKLSFEDFIVTVDPQYRDFVKEQHDTLTNHSCKIEVKEAKSGYLVSYTLNKKTVLNYVFRKKGLIARIYANHVIYYMEFLDTLPEPLKKEIKAAPICKRLVNPDSCNSKCSMGYDFLLGGERLQKCRNNAFMFLLTEENNPFIAAFINKELEASSC